MNKQRHHIIQFVCILTVLVAVMLQGFTKVVKMKPLKGFTQEEKPVALDFKTYWDGTYQGYLTEHAKLNTGFREFFIRNYNQVCYSCFNKITNKNIVKGYHQELYLKMYLDEVTGKRLEQTYHDVESAKAAARDNVESTLALIDTLRKHGTEFLFVFAPSKTAIYPEMMPKEYQKQILDFSLEEYYIELFKESNIPHIDLYHHFQDLKGTFPYPLYPRTGTHWSEATIPFVADTILKKLESLTGYDLPSVLYLEDNLTTDYSVQDGELEASMNLLFPLDKPALPRPVFTLTDTVNADKPNLLVISDSYFTQLLISPFVEAFNHWDCWFYNRDTRSSRPFYDGKHMNMFFDAAEIVEDADIVMAIFTAPMYYTYMFDFTNTAQELLQKGIMDDQEAIQVIINNILDTPEWLEAVEKQAEELGLTTEENIYRNAEYVLRMNKLKKEQQ